MEHLQRGPLPDPLPEPLAHRTGDRHDRHHVRFTEPFAVPGDDTTFTVISSGTILKVRPVAGPALLRIVGTLVEPPDSPATFSGNVTVDGVTTRYADVPYDSVFTFELFADAVCRAATGSGAAL